MTVDGAENLTLVSNVRQGNVSKKLNTFDLPSPNSLTVLHFTKRPHIRLLVGDRLTYETNPLVASGHLL